MAIELLGDLLSNSVQFATSMSVLAFVPAVAILMFATLFSDRVA